MRETPQFPPDFVRYLEVNGWKKEEVYCNDWTSFHRNDMRVIVKGDVIDVFILSENPRKPSHLLYSFNGWPLLSDFTFMLLMHVMNVVPLKDFIRKAKRESADETMTIDRILEHFGVEHLPEAY